MKATLESTLEITCQACGATIVLEPRLRTADCPYCASPNIVERPPAPDRPRPTFVLGFSVDAERAREITRHWLSNRGLFAHGGLKRAVLEKTRGLYLPAYLFSALGSADYSAEIGEEYTATTISVTGKGLRTETRIEWRKLAGRWEAYVRDILVTASRGIANDQLTAIEPFDLQLLRRFEPAVISGWFAEEPSLDRETCMQLAHDESLKSVGRELEGFMPGDRYRYLKCQVDVRDEAAELVLLPVWVFAVRYAPDKPPVRFLINGQTGAAAGKLPLSVRKIVFTVLLAIASVVAVWFVLSMYR